MALGTSAKSDARRELIRGSVDARRSHSAHAPTIANTYIFKAMLEMLRDDAEATLAARRNVVLDVAENSGLAALLERGSHAPGLGAREARRSPTGSARFRRRWRDTPSRQHAQLFRRSIKGCSRKSKPSGRRGSRPGRSIERSDWRRAGETGEHWFDAGLHRIRGEILLKQNPADPAPAEAAFLAAIAVAQQQRARSFELRAALSLAKLYQSTGRPIDAHDVLGPALEGFSPTPEFPQIAEAKALFEALAADEEVKAEAARRAQRLKLQTDYGQAVMWSKGFAAEETKAAFARVGELATEIGDAEAPLDAYYARWAAQFISRRTWVGPGNGRELPARSGTRGAADGGGGRASHFRIDSASSKAISRRRGRIANRRCEFTTPSETAKPSSASVRTLEPRRPLIWLSRLGASATSDAHGS